MCQEAGLVEGDKVFLDATLLKANASLDSLVEREACPGSKRRRRRTSTTCGKKTPWRALTTRAGAVRQAGRDAAGRGPGKESCRSP